MFEGDEVEDLTRLLTRVKNETGAEAVSVGAILSDYQRVRVESVCLRLSLVPLAYLWRRGQVISSFCLTILFFGTCLSPLSV